MESVVGAGLWSLRDDPNAPLQPTGRGPSEGKGAGMAKR